MICLHQRSELNRHDRYGPRRARVSRRGHEMQKLMAEREARLNAKLDAKRMAFVYEMGLRRAELDR